MAPAVSIRSPRIATTRRVSPFSVRARNPPAMIAPGDSAAASSRRASAAPPSAFTPPSAVTPAARGRRTTSAAAARHAAAPAAKTAPGLATARMAAAVSGPTSTPVPSSVPDRPFAAVSSSGVRERDGRSAPWAGRVTVNDEAAAAAARYTTAGGAPASIPAAVTPKAAAWTR